MGRAPCCDKTQVKRGPWSLEEDTTLKNFIEKHGTGGNWISFPHKAGLKRCGKSCRLRWLNYLRPNIKHGGFTDEEDEIILTLYHNIGSRWSIIASQLSGRTDNDVKNYWNTKLKRKFFASATSARTAPRHVTAWNNDPTCNTLPHETDYYPESSRRTFIPRPDIAPAPFHLSGVTKYPENLKSNEFNSSNFTPYNHEAVSSLSESSTSVNNSVTLSDFGDLGSDLSSLDHFLSAFDDFDGMNQSLGFSPYSSLEDDETHFTYLLNNSTA